MGNAIVGNDVNLEVGSVLANHFNERANKNIVVKIGDTTIDTKATKFGSVLGDGCRIRANAVLNPGSILEKDSIIRRLQYSNLLALIYFMAPIIPLKKLLMLKSGSSANPVLTTTKSLEGMINTRWP